MKPTTYTLIMGILLALPMLIGKRTPATLPIDEKKRLKPVTDDDRLYDIYDFMS